MCDNGIFLKYLLGATFKDDKVIENYNAKPRVNINFQDAHGRTALHYALDP